MMVTATFTAVATPHALILTVSHDLLFRQPPSCATALVPPFPFRRSLGRIEHQHRAGIHAANPPVGASMQSRVNLNNTALATGLTAVLPIPRYARDCLVQMRATPDERFDMNRSDPVCRVLLPYLAAFAVAAFAL